MTSVSTQSPSRDLEIGCRLVVLRFTQNQMHKIAKGIVGFFDRTISLGAVAASGLIVILMLIICADIAVRSLFHGSLPWVLEVSEFSMLFICFLGAAQVLKQEGHVTMDAVISQLKPTVQFWLNAITSIVGALVCLAITWYGIRLTWFYWEKGYLAATIMQPPVWVILSVIPFGAVLLVIQFIRRTHGFLKKMGK